MLASFQKEEQADSGKSLTNQEALPEHCCHVLEQTSEQRLKVTTAGHRVLANALDLPLMSVLGLVGNLPPGHAHWVCLTASLAFCIPTFSPRPSSLNFSALPLPSGYTGPSSPCSCSLEDPSPHLFPSPLVLSPRAQFKHHPCREALTLLTQCSSSVLGSASVRFGSMTVPTVSARVCFIRPRVCRPRGRCMMSVCGRNEMKSGAYRMCSHDKRLKDLGMVNLEKTRFRGRLSFRRETGSAVTDVVTEGRTRPHR